MNNAQEVQKAIENYLVENNKSVKDLAEDLGVSKRTVNSWLDGKASKIKKENWIELKPLIRDFLDEQNQIKSQKEHAINLINPQELRTEHLIFLKKFNQLTPHQHIKLLNIMDQMIVDNLDEMATLAGLNKAEEETSSKKI